MVRAFSETKKILFSLSALISLCIFIAGFSGCAEKAIEEEEQIPIIPEEKRPKVPAGPVSVATMDVRYQESDGRMVPGRIYYPLLEADEKYPGIVFCGGWMGNIEQYHTIPREIAKSGYVTLIFKPTDEDQPVSAVIKGMAGVWAEDMKDAITYLLEESPVADRVDPDKIGIIGHSMGGITVSKVAAEDERVKAGVILSCADLSKINQTQVPIQIQGADFDIGVAAAAINVPAFYAASPPKQLIIIQGGTHNGFSNFMEQLYPKPSWQMPISLHYSLAWFDYYLKDNQDALVKIKTPTEHLSNAWLSTYDLGDGEVKMSGPGVRTEEVFTLAEIAEELNIEPIGYEFEEV